MKKRLAITSLAIVALVTSLPKPSQAQWSVTCTNCASETTQWLNKINMAKQLANQAQQIQTQLSQYQNALQNTAGSKTQIWGNAQAQIQRLNSLLQQSRALTAASKNVDGQFAAKYQGYKAYANSKNQNWQQQLNQIERDNNLYALKAASMQNAGLEQDTRTLQNLQALSGNTKGQMEALQVANMMAAQQIEQMQQLRQLLMNQMAMQANYYQIQQERAEAERAAHERLNYIPNIPSDNGKSY